MSDKEKIAIERLKIASEESLYYYNEPLMITYSGGKDSDVLLLLAERAGIPYEVCHSHTTADAPETVRYVRETFEKLENKGVKCTYAHGTYKGKKTSMWDLIVQKKIPPTRLMRYCCSILKETAGDNRYIVTGVRWAESAKRKNTSGIYEEKNFRKKIDDRIVLTNDNDDKRQLKDVCRMRNKVACNPIVDWTDTDVWDYLNESGSKGNPLYCMGLHRVGCIGCPLANKIRETEFKMFPGYRKLYVHTFDKMLYARRVAGFTEISITPWRNGEDVMRWWLGYDHSQITFDDLENADE